MHVWVLLWCVSASVLIGIAITTHRLLTAASLAMVAIDAPEL